MSDDELVEYYVKLTPEIVGKIDVLIHEKLYDSRDKFIERALTEQLNLHQSTFDDYEKKKVFVIGVVHYSAKGLEKYVAKGQKIDLKVIGKVGFALDVTPQLITKAFNRITVAGSLKGPDNVLEAVRQVRYTLSGKPYVEDQDKLLGTDYT